MSIAQNQALFALLGTTYGGDGVTTFALPDVRGRMTLSQGQGPGLSSFTIGQVGGTETTQLTIGQLPAHVHQGVFQTVNANAAQMRSASNSFAVTADNQYSTNISSYDGNLHADTLAVQKTGDGLPFSNLAPFLTTRYCIALQGIFPSRN